MYCDLPVKIKRRKILSLIGSLLVMLPFLYAVSSVIVLQVNKWEMKEQLEQQSLQTITLTSADTYYWEEEGKEIRINGDMFDVSSYTMQGNNLVVTGLFDRDEDKLNDQVAEFFIKQNQNKNGNHSNFHQLISQLFLEDQFNTASVTPPAIPVIKTNLYASIQLSIVNPETFTPPPRKS